MARDLKKSIRKATKSMPAVHGALRSTYYMWKRASNQMRTGASASAADLPPPHVIMVPLERLVHVNSDPEQSRNAINTIPGESSVIGGDWDQMRTRLEDMPLYEAIRQRIEEGTDLRDTALYKGAAPEGTEITTGSWHAVYEQNVDEKQARIDALVSSIREKGYQGQKALGTERPNDEITVRIARDGEVLLENSIHRTIVARILGVDAVPACVSARHPGWMESRARFVAFARAREIGKLYGKLSHPDLWDIPHAHDLDDRLSTFAEFVGTRGGNALDLGCDTGFFSQFLSRQGYATRAVERDPDLASIAQLMSDIERLDVDFIVGDILDDAVISQYSDRHYSVVFTLNILHHFLKKQDRYEKLQQVLQGLDMDQLVLQCHRQDEPQMQDAYWNPSPEEFAQFVVDNSCLTSFVQVGQAADGRETMVITRDAAS